jgi:uncharacterized protein YjiS (DUF1127 family)
MTHIMTITAKPKRVLANPFKWMITAILHADKSYRDRQHVLTLSRRELDDVGLKRHDDHLVPISRNDLLFIAPCDFDEKH